MDDAAAGTEAMGSSGEARPDAGQQAGEDEGALLGLDDMWGGSWPSGPSAEDVTEHCDLRLDVALGDDLAVTRHETSSGQMAIYEFLASREPDADGSFPMVEATIRVWGLQGSQRRLRTVGSDNFWGPWLYLKAAFERVVGDAGEVVSVDVRRVDDDDDETAWADETSEASDGADHLPIDITSLCEVANECDGVALWDLAAFRSLKTTGSDLSVYVRVDFEPSRFSEVELEMVALLQDGRPGATAKDLRFAPGTCDARLWWDHPEPPSRIQIRTRADLA